MIQAQLPSLPVSIRSPHRSKGRRVPLSVNAWRNLFQSAPLTEARGDLESLMNFKVENGFNPLPSPKQGETHCARACSKRRGSCFNPLPSPKQGETARYSRWYRAWACFNPLPSPKQGETVLQAALTSYYHVSIRSPHRSKGRLR